jgi:transposase
VEAAWAAARSPGPLRAFFRRVAARRGQHVAAVATASKLAVVVWHMLSKGEDYLWVRPALLARKFRAMELKGGAPVQRGPRRGSAHAYNVPEQRARERRTVEEAEAVYHRFTVGWKPRPG